MGIIQNYTGVIESSEGRVEGIPTPPVSGIFAWYGNLVNNGVRRINLSNGTAITQWDDLSGNAYHVIQSTEAWQPTYNATGDSLSFDEHQLTASNFPALDDSLRTTFHVIKFTDQFICFHFSMGLEEDGGAIASKYYSAHVINDEFQLGNINWDTPSPVSGTTYLIRSTTSGTTWSTINVAVDGSNLNRLGFIERTFITSSGLRVGSFYEDPTFSNELRGEFYELMIYDRLLNPTDITTVENYLNNKYTIY